MRSSLLISLLLLAACSRSTPTKDEPPASSPVSSPGAAPTVAAIGKPAPEFELPDVDGKRVRLADHRGKTVVLEWFNPECPYVKASHTKGSLKDTAQRHTARGVVWLAINSGAPGRQGHGADKNRQAAAGFGMRHPILLDDSGRVGRAYGALKTPHMYVINPEGVLVYAGAIDNSPDGEGESPSGDRLVSYVDEALAALAAGKPVAQATSEAYGCSVKYAD